MMSANGIGIYDAEVSDNLLTMVHIPCRNKKHRRSKTTTLSAFFQTLFYSFH